jgi:hypothetical protein
VSLVGSVAVGVGLDPDNRAAGDLGLRRCGDLAESVSGQEALVSDRLSSMVSPSLVVTGSGDSRRLASAAKRSVGSD